MTNTASTFHEKMPSVGEDKPPPEFLSSVDPNYNPKDKKPENTERMTGGDQPGDPDKVSPSELGVGEMEGAAFKVEPIRRTGEDAVTMRARLLCPSLPRAHEESGLMSFELANDLFTDQCRKRGTLESDLLLSTFAAENLSKMDKTQLQELDLFLDENDWDIYYWATQSPANTPTSQETAEGAITDKTNTDTAYMSPANPGQTQETDAWRQGAPRSGEWSQTVGTFKPAYRPVPQRWKDSEILKSLRKHVRERSAGGVLDDVDATPKSKGSGLGRMPEVSVFE